MNFGRYRAGKRLGEGSLGVVYEGWDGERPFAVKVLHPWLGKDPKLVKSVIDLGHALTLLSQPEIARLHEAGRLPDERVFLVLEYVAGETLAVRLRRAPLSTSEALQMARRISGALAAAQKKGIAHLGLKPQNVMLLTDAGGERIKVLDLGILRLLGERAMQGAATGYLAPEQIEHDPAVGGQADVYALGVMFYEMLSGKLPRGTGGSLSGISGLGAPPTPLGQLVPALSKDVVALVQAMMGRAPDRRPAMGDVATRLSQLEEDLLVGQSIGSYRVLGKLGQGGMGTVFRAVNEQIGRNAAIKVMRQHFAQTAEVAKRFLNEARAVNLIRHPSLVEIFEFGQLASGAPYLVMEFLEGESLQQRRQKRGGAIAEFEAKNLIRQVALAVAAAHAKGIIHRDIKPDNLMIIADPIAPGGERIKLLDFGIAKVSAPAPGLSNDGDATQLDTHVGSLMGTPTYMAPEQFHGAGQVTDKTDVYALGVILYELLAGRRPYEQVGILPMSEPPKPLLECAPHVTMTTAALTQRMLSFRPADRPPMSEVADQLVQMLTPQNIDGAPISQMDFAPTVPEPLGSRAMMEASGPASILLPRVGPTGPSARTPVSGFQGVPEGSGSSGLSISGPTGSAGQFIQPSVLSAMGPRRWLIIGGFGVAGLVAAVLLLVSPGPEGGRGAAPQGAAMQGAGRSDDHGGQEAKAGATDIAAQRAAALATLREGLRDSAAPIRAAAALGLGATRDVRHQMLLEPLLRDPDPLVQARAAEALGQIQARSAAPAVASLLERTLDGGTFVSAASALAELSDSRGPRRLREALLAKELAVKMKAALALTDRGDVEARRVLSRLAKQPGMPADTEAEALSHLARAGDAGAPRDLLLLLEAPETGPEGKIAAAAGLGRLGEERGKTYLSRIAAEPGPQQLLAARRLAGLSDGRSDMICEKVAADVSRPLQDRLLAVEVLGVSDRPEEALLGSLLQDQSPPRLRLKAAESLLLRAARPATGK